MNRLRNAECGMRNSGRGVRYSAHRIPHSELGTTLLELLVAVLLLGLVSLGLLFSLRIGSSAWHRGDARVLADHRVVGAAGLLTTQLAEVQVRRVRWGPDERRVAFVYFDGAPQRLRFLTRYSLREQSRGGTWLAEYFFALSEDGACELLYNERPFQDDADAAFSVRSADSDPAAQGRPHIVFAPARRDAETRVLYRGLRQCQFEYLIEPPNAPARWGSQWETNDNSLPRAAAARFSGTERGGIAPVAMVATLRVREVAP